MQRVEKYKYKNSWTQDLKWCTIPILLVFSLVLPAKAHTTGYYHKHELVTMDVVKSDGYSSGTFRCPTVRDCYLKVLEAEERGARQYCQSVTIKRNGKTVWFRGYSQLYTPYFYQAKDGKGFPYDKNGQRWQMPR